MTQITCPLTTVLTTALIAEYRVAVARSERTTLSPAVRDAYRVKADHYANLLYARYGIDVAGE